MLPRFPALAYFAGGPCFDGGDFVDGDFHAQRASFDFGGGPIDAAENHGLVESAHAKAGPWLEASPDSRASNDSGLMPRSFWESEIVCTTAALNSSLASPRSVAAFCGGLFFPTGSGVRVL